MSGRSRGVKNWSGSFIELRTVLSQKSTLLTSFSLFHLVHRNWKKQASVCDEHKNLSSEKSETVSVENK